MSLNFMYKIEKLINPLNSVILGRDDIPDPNLHYTKCIATPDGWTFAIPNHDSISYGYLFNNTITDKKDAAKNLTDMFGIIPDGNLDFENYIAKNGVPEKRKLSFLRRLKIHKLFGKL